MNAPDQAPSNLTGRVVRGVSLAGSGFILARTISLTTYIVLARLVTPTELGQFTAGSILVGIGLLLAGSGMQAALIQRRDRLEEAAATAVIATVLAGLVIALIGWAVSPLIGSLFDSSTVAAVAAAMAPVLFLQSTRVVPNALLQRRFSFLRRLVVEPASAIAFGIGAIVATSSGLGVWGLVIGQYAAVTTDLILSWGLVQWRPKLSLASFAMWRELVRYGRHVLAGTTVRRVGDRIPILATGAFVGNAALGQLQYANRIVTTPFAMLVTGVSYVVFPAFARISQDGRRLKVALLKSLRWTAMVSMPIGLILIALGEPLAILVFGERWSEAGEATRALCLFIPAQAIAAVLGEGFKGAGQPPERTKVNIAGVLAGVATMAALLPLWGLIGVAIGISVDAIVSAGFSISRTRRALGVPPREALGVLAAPFFAALLMVTVLLPVEL
ncbi:MAG TPA: oligosaccharide flippase family protein, partial [Polyangia bacterium]|nr:oligosaccharide flippase family protein [Polyangia bacterium]